MASNVVRVVADGSYSGGSSRLRGNAEAIPSVFQSRRSVRPLDRWLVCYPSNQFAVLHLIARIHFHDKVSGRRSPNFLPFAFCVLSSPPPRIVCRHKPSLHCQPLSLLLLIIKNSLLAIRCLRCVIFNCTVRAPHMLRCAAHPATFPPAFFHSSALPILNQPIYFLVQPTTSCNHLADSSELCRYLYLIPQISRPAQKVQCSPHCSSSSVLSSDLFPRKPAPPQTSPPAARSCLHRWTLMFCYHGVERRRTLARCCVRMARQLTTPATP